MALKYGSTFSMDFGSMLLLSFFSHFFRIHEELNRHANGCKNVKYTIYNILLKFVLAQIEDEAS